MWYTIFAATWPLPDKSSFTFNTLPVNVCLRGLITHPTASSLSVRYERAIQKMWSCMGQPPKTISSVYLHAMICPFSSPANQKEVKYSSLYNSTAIHVLSVSDKRGVWHQSWIPNSMVWKPCTRCMYETIIVL